MNVGAAVAAVGMEQSAVSSQLRHLRDLGFVVAERYGRTIIDRLFDHHGIDLIGQASRTPNTSPSQRKVLQLSATASEQLTRQQRRAEAFYLDRHPGHRSPWGLTVEVP